MTLPVAGIAFDLDGTLADSAGDIAVAINGVLAGRGLPEQSTGYVEQFIGEGTRQLVAGVHRGLGVEVSGTRLDEDVHRYLELYRRSPVARTRLYPGVRATLERLHDAGVVLGVCTNKAQEVAETVLDRLGIGALTAVVVGGDALPVHKPDPGHLLTVLERMGVAPERALMVGDSGIDVACAVRAGVRCVVVGWAPPAVGAEGTTRIQDFTELLDVAGLRNGQQQT